MKNTGATHAVLLLCAIAGRSFSRFFRMDETGGRNLSSMAVTSVSIFQSTAFIVLMICTMVFSLFGNSLVLFMIHCSSGYHHRPVCVYVTSLAIGDMVTAVLSISTELHWDVLGQGRYGNVTCKVSTYSQCFLFVGKAFVLVSMSHDCYQAICRPMSLSRSRQRNRLMVLISFCLAAIVSIPQVFIFLQVDTGLVSDGQPILACRSHGYSASWQRKLNVTWLALCVFVAPLCAITISGVKIATTMDVTSLPFALANPLYQRYPDRKSRVVGRIKLRAIKLTILVLLAHIFCWTPYFSVNLLNVWTDYRMKDSVPYAVILISQCTAWFSSCVNLIIYGAHNFRMVHLRSIFCRISKKKVPVTDEPFRTRVRLVSRFDSFRRSVSQMSMTRRQFPRAAFRKPTSVYQTTRI